MIRFSETEKWKDEWFSSLTPIEKLVFLFIIDNCDNAGFFELNQRVNSFLIGISEEEYLGAIKGLNRGLLGAKDGRILWIKKFLFHQRNTPLNIENNAHKKIISIIQQKANLFDCDFEKILGAKKGLISPIGISKGKVEVKEKIEFEKFWQLYPNKIGKAKCETKWNNLKLEEQELIIQTLPKFIAYKPFESYNHPNPETYLNQKRWEDELKPKNTEYSVTGKTPEQIQAENEAYLESHRQFWGEQK